jgi:hypothetical protein
MNKKIALIVLLIILYCCIFSTIRMVLAESAQGNTLTSVKFINSSTGYACGHAGTFMKTRRRQYLGIVNASSGYHFST